LLAAEASEQHPVAYGRAPLRRRPAKQLVAGEVPVPVVVRLEVVEIDQADGERTGAGRGELGIEAPPVREPREGIRRRLDERVEATAPLAGKEPEHAGDRQQREVPLPLLSHSPPAPGT